MNSCSIPGTTLKVEEAKAVEIRAGAFDASEAFVSHVSSALHHDRIGADMANEVRNLRAVPDEAQSHHETSQHRIASVWAANSPRLRSEIEGECFFGDPPLDQKALSEQKSAERQVGNQASPGLPHSRLEEGYKGPLLRNLDPPRVLDQVRAGDYVVFAVEKPFRVRLDKSLEGGAHLPPAASALRSFVGLQSPAGGDFRRIGVGGHERQAIGVELPR